jgi:hypothetical protein
LSSGCFGTSEGVPYYTVSSDFAQYCWFDQDSKWTYINEKTGVTGDITIGEVFESKRFNPENTDYNYQAVEMILLDNVLNMSKQEITAGDYQIEEGEMNSLLRYYYNDGSYQLIFMPQYPIGEEIILGEDLGVYTNVEILSQMDVNNNTYPDVWHTNIVISNSSTEMNFYVAKGYSLIKSETIVDADTTVISLVSSSLIPHVITSK